MGVLNKDVASWLNFVKNTFAHMIDRSNTEVMLVVNKEEANWDVTLLMDVVHDLGRHHHTWVLVIE